MSGHLTLIRCPSAFDSYSERQIASSGPHQRSRRSRLTTPDAMGRRFVLTLIHTAASPKRPDPKRQLDHPA